MKLTDEQREIVSNNHDLIYWYAHKYGINLDEYYDLLAIELCTTVMHYEASKGSLSNYFKIRADNRMNKEYAKQSAKKRSDMELVSLDELYDVGEEDDVIDKLFRDSIELQDEFGILSMKASGLTQSDIAKKLGVSQSFVSRRLKEYKELYDKGIK